MISCIWMDYIDIMDYIEKTKLWAIIRKLTYSLNLLFSIRNEAISAPREVKQITSFFIEKYLVVTYY